MVADYMLTYANVVIGRNAMASLNVLFTLVEGAVPSVVLTSIHIQRVVQVVGIDSADVSHA